MIAPCAKMYRNSANLLFVLCVFWVKGTNYRNVAKLTRQQPDPWNAMMKLLLVTDNLQPYSIKTDKQKQRKKITQYICNAIITTCSTNNIGLVADQIPTEFSYQITWYKAMTNILGTDGQKISQFCCLPKFGWLDTLIAPYIWWNSHDTNIYLIHMH